MAAKAIEDKSTSKGVPPFGIAVYAKGIPMATMAVEPTRAEPTKKIILKISHVGSGSRENSKGKDSTASVLIT